MGKPDEWRRIGDEHDDRWKRPLYRAPRPTTHDARGLGRSDEALQPKKTARPPGFDPWRPSHVSCRKNALLHMHLDGLAHFRPVGTVRAVAELHRQRVIAGRELHIGFGLALAEMQRRVVRRNHGAL